MSFKLISLLLICSIALSWMGLSRCASAPNCFDESGNPVDWYIAYKFPDLSDQKGIFSTGFAYAYITSDQQQPSRGRQVSSNKSEWIISERLINDNRSMVMRTLAIAYQGKASDNPNSIFYNDQPPKDNETTSSRSRAHSKGVVLIDDITGRGIWLTHSVSIRYLNSLTRLHLI